MADAYVGFLATDEAMLSGTAEIESVGQRRAAGAFIDPPPAVAARCRDQTVDPRFDLIQESGGLIR